MTYLNQLTNACIAGVPNGCRLEEHVITFLETWTCGVRRLTFQRTTSHHAY